MKTPYNEVTSGGNKMVTIPLRLFDGMELEIHDLRVTLHKIGTQVDNLNDEYFKEYCRRAIKEQFKKDYR